MTQVVQHVGAAVEVQYRALDTGAVTLTVTDPNGDTSTPTPTNSGVVWTASLTPTLPGQHLLLWERTGGERYVDVLDMWPVNPRYLVSRADVIDRLRLSDQEAKNATRLAAIPLYIAVATAIIEDVTGKLLPSSRTWKTSGTAYKRAIVLPAIDVTVTSVTVDGTALASTAYTVDEAAGIVYSDSLTEGDVNIVVAFTVGSVEVPAQARLACLEVVAHLWQISRQGASESAATDEVVTTPMGFALPKRAWEMVQSIPRAQGIA